MTDVIKFFVIYIYNFNLFSFYFCSRIIVPLKPWPTEYQVPRYAIPMGFLKRQDDGEKLDKEGERSDLLGALYQDVSQNYTL